MGLANERSRYVVIVLKPFGISDLKLISITSAFLTWDVIITI